MSNVTKAVSEFVKDKGYQTSVIAKKTGISVNSLYKSFGGNRRLRADEYLSLCDFLGVDPREFRKTA